MNIHEYQAKRLLSSFGVTVPRGDVAFSPEEAAKIAKRLGGRVVVKAQIHAGGRGKAGGIRISETPQEAASAAKDLIGGRLVTHQTGGVGAPVHAVLVEEAVDIRQEWYLAMLMSTNPAAPMVVASPDGGVDIESVARSTPERIHTRYSDHIVGLSPYKMRDICEALEIPIKNRGAVRDVITGVFRLFTEKDCSLVEINPLILTGEGQVVAADGKVTLEDDALFKHPDMLELQDTSQMNELELRAANAKISYVKLDGGNVGCMVNGAGLAMATMDVIKDAGAEPANFLDVGGSTDKGRIEEAFRIIMADPEVKVILINLFAGIARADVVAEGIIAAAEASSTTLPIVVAMRGTNAEEGRRLLSASSLRVVSAADLAGAAVSLHKLLEEE